MRLNWPRLIFAAIVCIVGSLPWGNITGMSLDAQMICGGLIVCTGLFLAGLSFELKQ